MAKTGASKTGAKYSTKNDQHVPAKQSGFVGWISFFTSTTTPPGGSVKRDPSYAATVIRYTAWAPAASPWSAIRSRWYRSPEQHHRRAPEHPRVRLHHRLQHTAAASPWSAIRSRWYRSPEQHHRRAPEHPRVRPHHRLQHPADPSGQSPACPLTPCPPAARADHEPQAEYPTVRGADSHRHSRS